MFYIQLKVIYFKFNRMNCLNRTFKEELVDIPNPKFAPDQQNAIPGPWET